MVIAQESLESSVSTIWSSMLGLDAQPLGSVETRNTSQSLTGCIQITGAWKGAVMLDCPSSLALKAASIMFDMPPSEIDHFLLQDALGELTNIISGNFKSLLPEPCNLSLPAVTQGSDHAFRVLDSEVVKRIGFKCDNDVFVVSIVKVS